MGHFGSLKSFAKGSLADIEDFFTGSYTAKDMQQKSIDAQRHNMQNAHQWEVADLKSAGLNPVLSAGGASGSSPVASSGSVPNSGGSGIAGLISSVGSIASIVSQIKKNDADVKNLEAHNKYLNSQSAKETSSAYLEKVKSDAIGEYFRSLNEYQKRLLGYEMLHERSTLAREITGLSDLLSFGVDTTAERLAPKPEKKEEKKQEKVPTKESIREALRKKGVVKGR